MFLIVVLTILFALIGETIRKTRNMYDAIEYCVYYIIGAFAIIYVFDLYMRGILS